jgi:hypothetical protein
MPRASSCSVLFEVAPEDSAHRIAEALIAAERGDPEAFRWLTEPALGRLRSDAENLVALVPYAFVCLTEQLSRHARSAVRIDAVRYAQLAAPYAPEHAGRILRRLRADTSRGVARAAEMAAAPILSSEPISLGDLVEIGDSL